MTKLADVFVELRSDANRFAAEARSQISTAVDSIRAAVGISADTSGLRAEVSRGVGEAIAGQHADIPLGVDADGLSEKVRAEKAAATPREGIKIPVEVDNGELERELAQIPAKAAATERLSKITVEVDTDRSGLDRLSASLGKVRGEGEILDNFLGALKFGAIAGGAAEAAAGLSSLSAGAVGLVASLSSLIGLLGAVPTALVGFAQGFAIFKLATDGIGDAVKAAGKSSSDAAKNSTDFAEAEIAAAERIKSARETLTTALERQQELQITGPRRAEEADRGLESAERALAGVQGDSRRAQDELNDARKEAIRDLEDLRDRVNDNLLSEQEAIVRLARVRQEADRTNRDPRKQNVDRVEAALAVARAEDTLGDIRRNRIRDAHDLETAEAKGVEGSDKVVAAKEREAAAHQEVLDALQKVSDAQRIVSDTTRENAKSQLDAARAVERATDGVTAALRAQDKAGRDAGSSATAAAKALDDLTPAGRAFAEFLISLQPLLESLKEDVAEAFLPGVQRGLESLLSLEPIIHESLVRAGGAFGDFFAKAGKQFSTEAFKSDFRDILTDSTGLMKNLGDTTLIFLHGLTDVAHEAKPLVDGLGVLAKEMAQHFSDWAAEGRKNGNLKDFFSGVLQTTRLILDVAGKLFELFGHIGSAAKPLGDSLFRAFGGVLDNINKVFDSVDGKNELRSFFDDALPPLKELFGLLGDVVNAVLDLGHENMPSLTHTLHVIKEDLLPVVVDLLRQAAPLGTAMIDAIGALARNEEFVGAFSLILDVLKGIVGFLSWIIENVPGVGAALGGLAAAFVGLRVFHTLFDPFIAGTQGFITILQRLIATVRAVAAAEGLGKLSALGTLFKSGTAAAPAAGAAAPAASALGGGEAAAGGAAAGIGAAAAPLAVLAGVVAAIVNAAVGLSAAFDDARSSAFRFGGVVQAFLPTAGGLNALVSEITGIDDALGHAGDALGEFTGLWEPSAGKTSEAAHRMAAGVLRIRLATGQSAPDVKKFAESIGIDLEKESKRGQAALDNAVDHVVAAADQLAQHAGFVNFNLARSAGVTIEKLQEMSGEADRFRTAAEASFQSQTSFADAFADKSSVTADQVGKFFADSLSQTETWSEDIRKLMDTGLDTAFIKTIAEKGPSADAEVKGLLAFIAAGGEGAVKEATSKQRTLFDNTITELNKRDADAALAGAGLVNSTVAGSNAAFNANRQNLSNTGGAILGTILDGATPGPDTPMPGGVIVGNVANSVIGEAPRAHEAGRNTGGNIFTGILDGIGEALGTAGDFIGGVVNSLVDDFRRFLGISSPSTVFAGIGRDIVGGLFKGVSDNWHVFTDLLDTLVSHLPGPIRHFLESTSPSRLFARIGSSIPEGMAVGVTQGMPGVATSLVALNRLVSEQFKINSLNLQAFRAFKRGDLGAVSEARTMAHQLAVESVRARSTATTGAFAAADRGDIGAYHEGNVTIIQHGIADRDAPRETIRKLKAARHLVGTQRPR